MKTKQEHYWVKLGTRVVLELGVYLRTLRTYQSNNAMVIGSQKQLLNTLDAHFQTHSAPIRLQFLECETFINEDLIGMGFQEFARTAKLTKMLRGYGVGEIHLEKGINESSLTALADAFSDVIHKRSKALPSAVDHIQMQPLFVGGAKGGGIESHQICVMLFAGLLSAIDGLQAVHEGGRVPSMLPFLRHIRLSAEMVNERGAVFQLLTANRNKPIMVGDSHHTALRTFDALGFGTSLGLSRTALMVLGLSSVLDHLTANHGAVEAAKLAAKLQTLGDTAPGVMMTLWDLELIRENGKGGNLAQILDVVDNFVRLSLIELKKRPASDFWAELQRSCPRARTLVNQFQQWKGTLPMGVLVDHPDLGQAILLDRGGVDGATRLAPISQWGEIAEPIEIDTTHVSPPHFGPTHLIFLPTDDRTNEQDRPKRPPFPLADTAGRKTLSIDDRFGGKNGKRFKVDSIAGQGAQATVFAVTDTRLHRLVAAKVARVPSPQQRTAMLNRFERELRLSSRVNHPHVLAVYDCGELEGGTPYVLLEWMAIGDLSTVIDAAWNVGQLLPLEYVQYYGMSIASAMRAVHKAGIVHRDLKPANVLIREDGVTKITDFGIAKDLSAEAATLTQVGQTLGTLGFMSPEQFVGLPGPQSDVFGFGVLLYQLTTGQIPVQERQNEMPNGVVMPSAWGALPTEWVSTFQSLLNPNPELRMQGFNAVLSAVQDLPTNVERDRVVLAPGLLPPIPETGHSFGTGGSHTGEPQGGPFENPSTGGPNDTEFIDDYTPDNT